MIIKRENLMNQTDDRLFYKNFSNKSNFDLQT